MTISCFRAALLAASMGVLAGIPGSAHAQAPRGQPPAAPAAPPASATVHVVCFTQPDGPTPGSGETILSQPFETTRAYAQTPPDDYTAPRIREDFERYTGKAQATCFAWPTAQAAREHFEKNNQPLVGYPNLRRRVVAWRTGPAPSGASSNPQIAANAETGVTAGQPMPATFVGDKLVAVVGQDESELDASGRVIRSGPRNFNCWLYGAQAWAGTVELFRWDTHLQSLLSTATGPSKTVLQEARQNQDRVKQLCVQSGNQTRMGSNSSGPRLPYP